MAPTRAEAIARMRAALARVPGRRRAHQYRIPARLMSAPSFVEPRLDTALIERERAHLFAPRGEPSRLQCGSWLRRPAGWQRSAGRRRPAMQAAGQPWDGRGAMGARRPRWSGALETARRRARTSESRRSSARPATKRRARSYVRQRGPPVPRREHHVFEWIDPYLPVRSRRRHGGLLAPMPGRVIAVL